MAIMPGRKGIEMSTSGKHRYPRSAHKAKVAGAGQHRAVAEGVPGHSGDHRRRKGQCARKHRVHPGHEGADVVVAPRLPRGHQPGQIDALAPALFVIRGQHNGAHGLIGLGPVKRL
jgi:hypothetical protein